MGNRRASLEDKVPEPKTGVSGGLWWWPISLRRSIPPGQTVINKPELLAHDLTRMFPAPRNGSWRHNAALWRAGAAVV